MEMAEHCDAALVKINKHAVWTQSVNSAFVVPGTILQHLPLKHKGLRERVWVNFMFFRVSGA